MAEGVDGDMGAHERTYDGFLRVLKVGAVVVFLLTAAVVVLIAS